MIWLTWWRLWWGEWRHQVGQEGGEVEGKEWWTPPPPPLIHCTSSCIILGRHLKREADRQTERKRDRQKEREVCTTMKSYPATYTDLCVSKRRRWCQAVEGPKLLPVHWVEGHTGPSDWGSTPPLPHWHYHTSAPRRIGQADMHFRLCPVTPTN